MIGPLTPPRNDRIAPGRGTIAVSRGSAASSTDSDLDAQQQAQIAAMRQAFDFEAAERAEIMREQDALHTLLMAFVKNEDEIMKKWISLI